MILIKLFGGIFVGNLLEYYRKSDGATTKKNITGCNSVKKSHIQNLKVATLSFEKPIHLNL
jgi:hypothetical protein